MVFDTRKFGLADNRRSALKNGNGFDVVIPDGISVTGRIVCREPKADEADQPVA
jgi:hypothetical protein